MNSWLHPVLLTALILVTQACTGNVIEMDPEFDDKNSSEQSATTDTDNNEGIDGTGVLIDECANEWCDPAEICSDGEPCPGYACCPCNEEGLGLCDEFNPYRFWTCEGGYYTPAYCDDNAVCSWDLEGDIACRTPEDLEDGECLGPSGFDPDCFECNECQYPGVSYCDYGFGNDGILSCNVDEFGRLCWSENPCEAGQQCEQGLKTNQAQCAYPGEYDCDYLGCTGVEFCEWGPGPGSGPGFGETDCGACGCCESSSEDLCWNDPQWGSYRLEGHQDGNGSDDDHSCYEPEPCPGNKLCILDDDGDAHCE